MMTPLARRQFLLSGSALAALPFVPGVLYASEATTSADAAAERMLGGVAEALLAEHPENAGALGLDTGARRALKSRLTDRSPGGVQQLAAAARQRLAQLRAINPDLLGPETRTHVAVATAAHALAVEGFGFGFGDTAMLNQLWSYRNAPYVVAQNMGAFVEIPDFLENSHPIAEVADADAYLARMDAYALALDGETARLSHDRGMGVVAPGFLLDKTLRQMKAARAKPIGGWGVVSSVARRTESMAGDHAAQAARIAADKIAPALDRQIAELERHRAVATADAGVWKLPQGDAYYDWALRAATTSSLSPDAVHGLGLEQVKSLAARMDVLLRAEGLTRGTVGERMAALGKDPRYLFPNTDAGRAQILEYINGRITDIRARMPRAFATLVPGNLVVKRVPPEIEAQAPWMAPCRASFSSICAIRRYRRVSVCRPSPITRAFRDTCGKANIATSCRSSARCLRSMPIRKVGRYTPSNLPTNSMSMKAIRLGGWVISSPFHSVPAALSSIPDCTPSAGPVNRR
jgi:uncharacterized protein (DUF885 family)